MKKLSIILVLMVVLTAVVLPCAAQAESEETIYVMQEKKLLAQKKVYGDYYPYVENGIIHIPGRIFDVITDYKYDEYGNLTEKKEYLSYSKLNVNPDYLTDITYDEAGNITSAKRDAGEFNGTALVDHLAFDNGLLQGVRTIVQASEQPLEEIEYTYDEGGQVIRERHLQPINQGASTEETVYEFNKDGYCTDYITAINDATRAIHFEYNENGRITRLSSKASDGSEMTTEVTYDETGLYAESLVETEPDGTVFTENYGYDELGRLITRISYDGSIEDRFEFSYNNYGYLSDIKEIKWGYQQGAVHYSYTETEDGVEARRNVHDWGPAVFSGSTMTFHNKPEITANGNTWEYEYYFDPITLQYIYTRTYYDYDMFPVLVEKNTENAELAASMEEYFPKLNQSYGGYQIPTPDGTLRLIRILYHQPTSLSLTSVTELLYDDEGNLIGEQSYFDGAKSYDILKETGNQLNANIVESDAYGRLSKVVTDADAGNTLVCEYIYPDDLSNSNSYTKVQTFGDQHHEKEYKIEDSKPSVFVRKTQEEIRPSWDFEYDGDGLVSKVIMTNIKDANGNPIELTNTYYYKQATTGLLEYVGGPSIKSVLKFNRNGYLEEYSLEPAGSGWLEFEYSSIN